ncbi:MAG: CoA transferase, partial [Acidimicrobiales bacterium]
MLSGVRVLDLTDHRGRLAGAILAALGAEVVLVEPPGGAPGRRRPPLAAGVSLDWWAYNRGKHSVICRSEAELAALLAEADVVLESPDPGERVLNGAALDREALAAAHPALVHVTITAFGSSGPKARWPASDLTVAAAGCQLALTGDADRPPVRTSVAQGFLHAGAEAACGALLALTERRRSGRGQHVDVSAQQAFMQAAIPGVYFAPNDNAPLGRISGGIAYGPYHLQFVYPAADGHVSITLLFGATIGRFTTRLMDWVEEEGLLPDELRGVDWLEFAAALAADPVAAGRLEAAKAAVAALTAGRTKAELFAEARRRELLLAPVATPAELFDSEQLAARGFWDEVEDPTLGR